MSTPSSLPRSSPEAQGLSSTRILDFIAAVEAAGIEFHSFMLVRHGQVVAEGWWTPYAAETPHLLYSFSKSFTSTAAGFAIAEGRFSLDDAVIDFFPDDLPAQVSPNLAAMKVRHLLSMACGHVQEPPRQGEHWIRDFLAQPVEKQPGTHFLYNSMATYMVSAIVQTTTGRRTTDYLDTHLFQPLGIAKLHSERCPRGIDIGGWGMSARTEDMAKLVLLYLQRGLWNGRRVLDEAWIDAATSTQVSNGNNPASDWCQGYGFQFWRCRHDAYRGDGAFGQYGIVIPAHDSVIAITSLVGDMQKPLDLVWEHLLPAFEAAPLREDAAARRALTERLATRVLTAPHGTATSPRGAQVAGVTYRFEPNAQQLAALRLDLDEAGGRLTLTDDRGTHGIDWGQAGWRRGSTTFQTQVRRDCARLQTAAWGGWVDADTLRFRVALHETPFCVVITCRFHDAGVTFDLEGNLGFGPRERPSLEGRRAAAG